MFIILQVLTNNVVVLSNMNYLLHDTLIADSDVYTWSQTSVTTDSDSLTS